jgi:hypothetical protein
MNATIPMNQKQPSRRGFRGIHCPLCGSAEDTQSIDLDDLHTLHCAGCGEDYTVDNIRQLMTAWQAVLAWIDAAPSVEE